MRAWKSNIYYAFLFTPEKLVAAKIGSQTSDRSIVGAALGGAVGYFLGSWSGKGDREKKAEAMQKVSVKSILEADKDNFEVRYSEITRFEMGRPSLASRFMSDSPRITGVIKITGKNEQKFQISGGQSFEDCVNIVRSVLPADKLVVR